MSQNPNGGPNYNPYGPNPSNPNYPPPTPGTSYGGPPPPSGPNPGYPPYQNPPSGPNPYQNPPSGPGAGTPNSSYGPYGPTYAPPPPGSTPTPMPAGPDTGGSYNPYDPTVLSQQQSSGAGSPSYPPTPGIAPLPLSPQQPQRNNGRMILIAVIALVVIVGGVLGVIFYNNHQQAVQQANATATAVANATGTANAFASATANAQATATYLSTHYPFSNNLVLNDPLTDDSHVAQYGWDENTSCSFSAGSYHAQENNKGFFHLCVANTPTFSNFTFEVQMAIKNGGTGAEGGVLFRADVNNDRFYVLFLDTQGNYNLDIQANQSGTNSRVLRSGQVSGYATGFFQVHTIGVVAKSSQITIYVDQKQVTQVTDTTYTSGQIGLISDYGSSPTEVVYNNVKVWQLS